MIRRIAFSQDQSLPTPLLVSSSLNASFASSCRAQRQQSQFKRHQDIGGPPCTAVKPCRPEHTTAVVGQQHLEKAFALCTGLLKRAGCCKFFVDSSTRVCGTAAVLFKQLPLKPLNEAQRCLHHCHHPQCKLALIWLPGRLPGHCQPRPPGYPSRTV